MTRDEAQAKCDQLQNEHADRETHTFVPSQDGDGAWAVAKVGIPPTRSALQAETKAEQRPGTADDPRDSHMRNVGPYVGPG